MRYAGLATAGRRAFTLIGVVLSACSTESGPTQPSGNVISLAAERQLDAVAHPGEALLRQLAADIPGFAGLWYDDPSGAFQVAASDVQVLAARSDAVRAVLAVKYPGLSDAPVKVHEAKYDFMQLADWRRRASVVFSDSRVIGLDLDERANRIAVIVSDEAARDGVSEALEGAGVPVEAVRIDVEEQQLPLIGLQDYNRPKIENGFRIVYVIPGGTGFCTLGADVTGPGGPVKGFLTNSHCNKLGGGQLNAGTGTQFYQHALGQALRIGASTINPNLFTGGACPAGKSCRYSDAQFVDYSSDTYFSNHQIAETTVIGTGTSAGSLTVASYRVGTSTANVVQGFVARKTGQTTGTTQGSVISTCLDTPYGTSTTIVMLCQDKISAHSQSGDSGAPVYFAFSYPTPTSTVYHVGLLWQGNGTVFTFSPWSGIASDLPVAY
jgi:hypothetical protein